MASLTSSTTSGDASSGDVPAPAAPPIIVNPAVQNPTPLALPYPLFQPLAPLTLKLECHNYFFWRSQVLPAVRAHDLDGFLFGTKTCPPRYADNTIGGPDPDDPRQVNHGYVLWHCTDQSLMSWLLNSISEGMFGHIVHCTSSHQVQDALEKIFTTESRALTLQLRFQLQATKKGSLTINDYILKMKNISESRSATGQTLPDEELVLYILGGLGPEYESVVVNLTSRFDTLSLQEVQYMLQSQEIRLDQLNAAATVDTTTPSVNYAGHYNRNSKSSFSPQGYPS